MPRHLFDKPPTWHEDQAHRAMKRWKWSVAARHFRVAAAVTAGHNRAARYIEAAERMERRTDGKPPPRSEVVRENPRRVRKPRVWTGGPDEFFVDVWEERDRLNVALYHSGGKLVAEWWDDEARQSSQSSRVRDSALSG